MLHGLSSTAFLCCLLNFVSKVVYRGSEMTIFIEDEIPFLSGASGS